MLLSEAIKEYADFLKLEVKGITMQRYLTDIRLFMVYVRNSRLSDIKDTDVISYLNLLETLEWEHNAVVRKEVAIKGFWRWMNKKGYKVFNAELIPDMKRDFKLPYVTPEKDYRKVLESLPQTPWKKRQYARNKAIIMMLWDTGARNGEICSLSLQDIDLVKMKAVVKTEKSRGRKPFRDIFWTKETNEALKEWIKYRHELQRKDKYEDPLALFVGLNNKFWGKRLTNSGLSIMMREAAHDAGLVRFNAHGLRHHMGHYLNEQGANNSQISSILGHAQLSSSYVYTELNNREREEAYNKFKRKR